MDITIETKIKNLLQSLSTVCFTCHRSKKHDCGTCKVMAISYGDIIKLINDYIKENAAIDRDIFRTVVSEFPPFIAGDSRQPEWAQGELDKCLDALMAEKPIKIR